MIELYDFRIRRKPDGNRLIAGGMFRKGEVRHLSDYSSQVLIKGDDLRFEEFCKLRAKMCGGGWIITRKYTKEELASAQLFLLTITACFEPPGVDYGTQYDESAACLICGAGRKPIGPLILSISTIPRGRDMAFTIADDEWIVSERFVRLAEKNRLTGMRFDPVRGPRKGNAETGWYRFGALSRPLPFHEDTHFGISPYEDDTKGKYRCPKGHVKGLNVLSEVVVKKAGWDGSDMCVTREYVGVKGGDVRPRQFILVSPAFHRLCQKEKVKGCSFEVAYLR
jgi:hypothetical protein